MDENEIRIRCFMDGIDWQHHLGEDLSGTTLYPDVEDVVKNNKCVDQCGIVEVEVRLIRWVKPQNLDI